MMLSNPTFLLILCKLVSAHVCMNSVSVILAIPFENNLWCIALCGRETGPAHGRCRCCPSVLEASGCVQCSTPSGCVEYSTPSRCVEYSTPSGCVQYSTTSGCVQYPFSNTFLRLQLGSATVRSLIIYLCTYSTCTMAVHVPAAASVASKRRQRP